MEKGVAVSTQPDIRWGRCDIKTVQLLPNLMAKQAAKRAGAFEAWLVDADGYVTEGASTTAWIVSNDGTVITRDLSNAILPGVTRRIMLALPRSLPNIPTLDFGASLRPSLHLAGDFYNIVRLDQHRVGVYLGDVMGHGPAAALLGVFAMQGLRTKSIEGSNYRIIPPEEVLAALNRDLIKADFPESPFVTMIYGVLDTSRGTFTYCCGGHPPALLLRPGEPPRRLESHSPLLGVFDMEFVQDEVELRPGDRVALYSDGAESIRWGHYGNGIDGLAALLSPRDSRSAQQMIDTAMEFAEPGDGPADDLTLVMVEVRA